LLSHTIEIYYFRPPVICLVDIIFCVHSGSIQKLSNLLIYCYWCRADVGNHRPAWAFDNCPTYLTFPAISVGQLGSNSDNSVTSANGLCTLNTLDYQAFKIW